MATMITMLVWVTLRARVAIEVAIAVVVVHTGSSGNENDISNTIGTSSTT